jgi:hypothetical protein
MVLDFQKILDKKLKAGPESAGFFLLNLEKSGPLGQVRVLQFSLKNRCKSLK